MKKNVRFGMCLVALCLSACGENGENKKPDNPGPGDVVIKTCDPKDDICLSQKEVLHCVDGVRKSEYCASGELCYDGKCGEVVCTAYEIESCLPDGRYHGCNALGTGTGDYDCEYGTTCVENACVPRLCEEGSGVCIDDDTIALCNQAGTAYSEQKKCSDIQEKTVCEKGACIPICDQTTKDASYIGCEYWAVDLDNAIDAGVYDAAGQPFAVVLSNTHPELTAVVKIFTKEAGKVVEVVSFEVPPNGLKSVILPNKCYDGGRSCGLAYSVNGTVITDTSFYIKSDLPITAAQFNPLDNVDVFSNDASLLFPTSAMGQRYMVMSRQQHYDVFHGFLTVVATQPGQTEVVVEASCKVMAGMDKAGKPIYAMKKGDLQTFYLNQYDILNLETDGKGEDFTGSMVTSDKLVAVFSGVEATSLPETDPVTCCADHIEHQLYPMGAWGRKYNAVKLKPRGKERDLWRILARMDDTRVVTTPNVFKQDAVTLNAGQWIDILTTQSFVIEASSPVLVGQFMTGQNDPLDPETHTQTPDWAGIGDPAFIIGVPVEQYRSNYQFLAPNKYEKDYITIVAPLDAEVRLDGQIVAEADYFKFGNGEYKAAYKLVSDGRHEISASKPIGLFSYGVDNYVSYGYAAGLDLKELFDE
ncbi:MAG: IgGFc-binding protein [Proteobacteria bacterium]|nr:IgGFc-binding protein [Pseudomonadota bacterium]